jgi:hypothetical protein
VSSVAAQLDQAGVIVRKVAGARVQGHSVMTPTRSSPFRCRIFPASSVEQRDERRGTVMRASLMTAAAFLDGAPVEIRSSDTIEVDSETWNVVGGPQELRGRSRRLGWLVPVERLAVPVREELTA